MVPSELLAVYHEIIKNAPTVEAAGAHLLNFLQDVKLITGTIQGAIDAARTRANSAPAPVVTPPPNTPVY